MLSNRIKVLFANMKTNSVLFFLFFLSFLTLSITCTGSKGQLAKLEEPIANSEQELPKILFVNIEVREEKGGMENESVSLINSLIVDGSLKQDFDKKLKMKAGEIACSFLDGNKELIKRTAVKNPLHKVYEYLGEDQEMHVKEVEEKKASFSLRTQMVDNIMYLKIDKVLENLETIHLKTFKL